MDGKIIKQLRKQHETTLKTLANELGLSESYLSYVENNHRKLKTEDLQKIASFFSVDLQFLLAKPIVRYFLHKEHNKNKILTDFRAYVDKVLP